MTLNNPIVTASVPLRNDSLALTSSSASVHLVRWQEVHPAGNKPCHLWPQNVLAWNRLMKKNRLSQIYLDQSHYNRDAGMQSRRLLYSLWCVQKSSCFRQLHHEELVVVWRCLRDMMVSAEAAPVTDVSYFLKPSFIQVSSSCCLHPEMDVVMQLVITLSVVSCCSFFQCTWILV